MNKIEYHENNKILHRKINMINKNITVVKKILEKGDEKKIMKTDEMLIFFSEAEEVINHLIKNIPKTKKSKKNVNGFVFKNFVECKKGGYKKIKENEKKIKNVSQKKKKNNIVQKIEKIEKIEIETLLTKTETETKNIEKHEEKKKTF